MGRTLVIKDPSDGVVLGRLKIPDGATPEAIVEAGMAAQAQLVAARRKAQPASAAHEPAPPPRSRELLCEVCRQPWPEDQFPAHIETERKKMEALERQALRR